MRRWVAALAGAIALVGCDPGESSRDRVIVEDQDLGVSGVDKLERRRLEQFASLSLPDRARILRSYASPGMDSLVEVTIKIDPKHVRGFAYQSELPAPRRGAPPFRPGSGKRIGWDVAAMRNVRVAEDRSALGVQRRVAVTPNGTVYLQAFET